MRRLFSIPWRFGFAELAGYFARLRAGRRAARPGTRLAVERCEERELLAVGQ